MDDVKQQVVDRLKQANNILVTVRNNPNVDLLSACIGLALVLDKMDKHAAAVFSGAIPSTIEFLKPEATLEKSPDSLRDFIIALDKSKADKLRYKVEDKVVRIFITPYKTSLSEKDLEFSQGDFNVDAVVALGAHEQRELDQAITQHGRILHDATVLSINNTPNGNLGAINWQDISASSVCELVAQLVKDLGKDLLDEQIATALLTGIVAETGRFSNEKTTPRTMSLAGDLMSAGANQQLVATELQTTPQPQPASSAPNEGGGSVKKAPAPEEAKKPDDGTLEIDHERELPLPPPIEEKKLPEPRMEEEMALPSLPKIITPERELLPPPEPHITNVHGSPLPDNHHADQEYRDDETLPVERSYLVEEPTIPSNTPKSDGHVAEPSNVNPFEVPSSEHMAPLLGHDSLAAESSPASPSSMPQPSQVLMPEPSHAPVFSPAPPPAFQMTPPPSLPPAPTPPAPAPMPSAAPPASNPPKTDDEETLEEIEESVHSPHVGQSSHVEPSSNTESQDLVAARNEVLEALKQGPEPLEPLQSLNANPLGGSLHSGQQGPTSATTSSPSMDVEVDDEGNLKPAPANEPAPNPESPANRPMDMPLPPIPGATSAASAVPSVTPPSSSTPPPPVPPPMMPPNFMSPGGQ